MLFKVLCLCRPVNYPVHMCSIGRYLHMCSIGRYLSLCKTHCKESAGASSARCNTLCYLLYSKHRLSQSRQALEGQENRKQACGADERLTSSNRSGKHCSHGSIMIKVSCINGVALLKVKFSIIVAKALAVGWRCSSWCCASSRQSKVATACADFMPSSKLLDVFSMSNVFRQQFCAMSADQAAKRYNWLAIQPSVTGFTPI